MNKIKVLIIDQSTSVCKSIKSILEQDATIEVVGTATEIKEGTAFILSADPHVVLLDVNLPTNDSKSALKTILEIKSLPIIMLAANTVKQTAKTVQSMSNGAIDFIKKQNGKKQKKQEDYEKEIINKVYSASKVTRVKSVSKKDRRQTKKINTDEKLQKVERQKDMSNYRSIIAIGTSTGGPRALQRIIEDIPKGFTVPILIVQHMPAKFTKSLAARLNNIGNMRIKEGTHGEVIQDGTAYIAPGNYHMVVKQQMQNLKIELHQDDDQSGHRPSVNVLFESISRTVNTNKVAVVLTGMGKDGAEGVQQIKKIDNDAIIIAESDETAIIDGMPSAAIATGYVSEVIQIGEIAKTLVNYTK